MATTIVAFAASTALSVGASYIASRLNRPKESKPIQDDKQPTLAVRGAMLPLVLGRRKVAPVIGWVGDPLVIKDEEGGGGKGFGGDGGGSVTYRYRQAAMHLICLGPATAIYRIWRNGKQTLEAPVTSATHPSGSTVTTKRGKFTVWWGEQTQPVNEKLGQPSRIGVRSSWPGVCYVHWDRAHLGTGGYFWPSLEYDVEVPLTNSPVAGTAYAAGQGCNPAHAAVRILTAPSPFGLGMGGAMLDGGAFEALGDVCTAEGLYVNMLCRDGVEATEALSNLMASVGFWMPQVGDVLVPVPVRPPTANAPTLDDANLVDPDPEVRQQHGDTSPSRTIFLYPDRDNNYKNKDVPLDDDAASRWMGHVKPKTEELHYVTAADPAKKIAQRRQKEEAVDGVSYTLRGTRQMRALHPGMMFNYPNLGRLRVTSRLPAYDSTAVTVKALLDQYGERASQVLPPDGGTAGGGQPAAPAPDPHVLAMELPDEVAGTSGKAIGVARVRAHDGIEGAAVWVSPDGNSYLNSGTQDPYASGGTLQRIITAAEGGLERIILAADAPEIVAWNDDIEQALDLTGNDAEWLAGAQVAVINGEWFGLQKVEASAAGWKLVNLKRGLFGTPEQTHPVGSKVFVFRKSQQRVFRGGAIRESGVAYVKTQPRVNDDAVDLAAVAPVVVSLSGPPVVPYTPAGDARSRLWLNPQRHVLDAYGVPLAADDSPVQAWRDGNGGGVQATAPAAANRPRLRLGVRNGMPVVRFDGADWYFTLPSFMTGRASGTVVWAAKLDADPPASGTLAGAVFGGFGTGGNDHHPFTDGVFYDGFGSTVRKAAGDLAASLASWHVVSIVSQAGLYRVRVNGVQAYATAANVVAWGAAPEIGHNPFGAFMDGDLGEGVVYGEALTDVELATGPEKYLTGRWGPLGP